MSWLALLGSGAVGGLLVKVVDALWLQRILQSAEKRKWFRERRLKAYTELTVELLTLGRKSDLREDAFRGYEIASEAILLTEDDKLASEIEQFFTWLANIFREAAIPDGHKSKRSEEELEAAYKMLHDKSRYLVRQLRKCLHEA